MQVDQCQPVSIIKKIIIKKIFFFFFFVFVFFWCRRMHGSVTKYNPVLFSDLLKILGRIYLSMESPRLIYLSCMYCRCRDPLPVAVVMKPFPS